MNKQNDGYLTINDNLISENAIERYSQGFLNGYTLRPKHILYIKNGHLNKAILVNKVHIDDKITIYTNFPSICGKQFYYLIDVWYSKKNTINTKAEVYDLMRS